MNQLEALVPSAIAEAGEPGASASWHYPDRPANPGKSTSLLRSDNAYLSGGMRAINLADSPDLKVTAAWAPGGRVIALTTREPDLAGGTVESAETFSTSFDLTDLAAGGSHLLFVAGISDNGNDLIEAWRLQLQPGSYFAVSPTTAPVIFEPPYRAPLTRPSRRPPAREVVFEGDLPGLPLSVVSSPSKRVLYAFFGTPTQMGIIPEAVYSIDVENGTAQSLYSAAADPFMRYHLDAMVVLRDPNSSAIAVRLRSEDFSSDAKGFVLLIDDDDDDTIDSGASYSLQDYDLGGYYDWRLVSK